MAGSFVMLLHFADAGRDFLDAVLEDLLGNLFLRKDNDFLDRAYAALQVLAYGQDQANHHGRARKRLQNAQLSALDTLTNIYFPYAGKQRHHAHLAQVYAHRIIGLFKTVWSQTDLNVLAGPNSLLH